jgi:hypothetical protein
MARDIAPRILQSTRAIKELFDSLFDLTRIDAGNYKVKLQHVDVRALLSDVALQFEPVAAAPVTYARPEPQTPVLTDEADVIDVVPERIRNIAEDVVKLNTPDARLRKKQPVAAMDEGADWEEATLIEKSTRSGQGAKGPWTVWKATLEMDNGKKIYPSTFDAELGAVLEECQEGETILVQIAAREYEDKKTGEMKKGYDLKAVSRQDVPAKAEHKASDKDIEWGGSGSEDSSIPF